MLLARGIPSSASNDLLSKLKVFLADNIFGLLSIRLCELLFFYKFDILFLYIYSKIVKKQKKTLTQHAIFAISYI